MVVGVVRIGAQRASLQQRLSVVLAGTFFATVFGFAVAAAGPAPAQAYTPPFYSVELYYLKLVNCTRTGGWVLSDGSCKGYGSGRYSVRAAAQAVGRAVERGAGMGQEAPTSPARAGTETPRDASARPATQAGRGARTSGAWMVSERAPVRPVEPPAIPGREVVRRRPLAQHQERAVQVDRNRRLEGRRPDAPRDRLLQLVAVPPSLGERAE